MKVVYKFYNRRSQGTSELNAVKKILPEARIEDLPDGSFALVLANVDSKAAANKVISIATSHGYWGGVCKSI